MIVLIILIITVSFSINNLANAIRESNISDSNGGIINELYRFNDNFEEYLEILKKKAD